MNETAHDIKLAKVLQKVRKDSAPKAREFGAKMSGCYVCGCTFWQWNGEYRRNCSKCSAYRQVSTATQMREKSGPIYEKTVLKQYVYWHSEVDRLGIIK